MHGKNIRRAQMEMEESGNEKRANRKILLVVRFI
jgi:hypothetical protein